MLKFDLIICDFDGTLVNTKNAIKKTTQDVLMKEYPDIQEDAIFKCIDQGLTLEDTFINLIPNIDTSKINELVLSYRNKYNSGFGNKYSALYPKVIETLTEIKNLNIPIVISSNKGEKAINEAISYFGISNLIEMIVGQTDGVKKKPNSDSYYEIIKPRINPKMHENRVLVVGDTAIDVRYANNIGAKSAFVSYGFGSIDDCKIKPSYVLSSFDSLLKIINN